MFIADHGLGDLAFVMREKKVHPPTMDIEFFTQIFCTHGHALNVPARETLAPSTIPAHDVFGWGRFQQNPVGCVCLLALGPGVSSKSSKILPLSFQ
jgi:hypothetical protein